MVSGRNSPSDAARGLRVVFDLLLQDLPLTPVEPDALRWDRPILVLRSADMKKMRAFLVRLSTHCPSPDLHVISHARDEDAIRAMAPCDITFHGYPTLGRYTLEGMPAGMLAALRAVDFGTAFFLDTGPATDLFDEVERLLLAIVGERPVSALADGTFARVPERDLRKRAEATFFSLSEWYQAKLDPGCPDGPVVSPTP